MYKHITLITCCVMTLMITISAHAQKEDIELSPSAFKNKMEKAPDYVLLDVRTPAEVKEGIIAGAKIIDFNSPDFATQIDKLDKDKAYFVYCKVGGRSSRTVDLMKGSGFKHVYNLKGGYVDWVKQGYPVVKP